MKEEEGQHFKNWRCVQHYFEKKNITISLAKIVSGVGIHIPYDLTEY